MIWKKTRHNELDAPIAQVLDRMAVADPEEPQYEELTKRLESLVKLRDGEKRNWTNSPAFITVVGNVVVTAMVIAYEKHNVMTSKARDWHVTTKS